MNNGAKLALNIENHFDAIEAMKNEKGEMYEPVIK
jgi:hypothetical protein